MRPTIAVLPMWLLLTGCGGRVAEFTNKVDDLLGEYQKRINIQVAKSTSYYQTVATLSAGQAERIRIESLQAERNERTTQLEADYGEYRKPISLYRNDLRAYAEADFADLKASLTSGISASSPYLAQLIALESDTATIDAYDKILKNLAQPRNIRAEIGDLQQFVADSKTDFSKLGCDGIDKQFNSQPPPTTEKTATLKALQKSQSCPKS